MQNKNFNNLYKSCLWLQFQYEMSHKKTFTKKATVFFGFQVWDFNISNIFYKIQNHKNEQLKPKFHSSKEIFSFTALVSHFVSVASGHCCLPV